jgi:hypothetical protein
MIVGYVYVYCLCIAKVAESIGKKTNFEESLPARPGGHEVNEPSTQG